MTVDEYEHLIRLRTTTREQAIAAYKAVLADYETQKVAAIKQVRAKLKNPHWHPFSWVSLNIGRPPTHPLTVGFRE